MGAAHFVRHANLISGIKILIDKNYYLIHLACHERHVGNCCIGSIQEPFIKQMYCMPMVQHIAREIGTRTGLEPQDSIGSPPGIT